MPVALLILEIFESRPFVYRSLERCLSVHEVGLRGGTSVTNDNTVTDLERERVRGIVLESESKDYWFAASKDGSRENHYRGIAPCTIPLYQSPEWT